MESTSWHPGCAGRAFIASDRALGLGPSGVYPLMLARVRAPETASYPHHFAKRPGVWCAGFAAGMDNLQSPNRRHACGGTAHEAKAGCHRHGCAVAIAPLIKAWRCTQRRFAGRIGSRLRCSPFDCEHRLRSHPCADMPGSRGEAHKSRQTACGGRKRPWQCSPSAVRWPHHSLTFVMPCAPV